MLLVFTTMTVKTRLLIWGGENRWRMGCCCPDGTWSSPGIIDDPQRTDTRSPGENGIFRLWALGHYTLLRSLQAPLPNLQGVPYADLATLIVKLYRPAGAHPTLRLTALLRVGGHLVKELRKDPLERIHSQDHISISSYSKDTTLGLLLVEGSLAKWKHKEFDMGLLLSSVFY